MNYGFGLSSGFSAHRRCFLVAWIYFYGILCGISLEESQSQLHAPAPLQLHFGGTNLNTNIAAAAAAAAALMPVVVPYLFPHEI